MEDSIWQLLRPFEKRLLLATVSPASAGGDFRPDASGACTDDLATLWEVVQFITRGEYLSALQKCSSYLRLSDVSGSDGGKPTLPGIVDAVHGTVSSAASSSRQGEGGHVAAATRCMIIMAFGVASLLLFMQANLTGPSLGSSAPAPSLAAVFNTSWAEAPLAGPSPAPGAAQDPEYRSALSLLAVDGEDVPQLVAAPQFLVLAQALLVPPALASLGIDHPQAHHGQHPPAVAGRGSHRCGDGLAGLARTPATPALMSKAKLQPCNTPAAEGVGQLALWPASGSLWAARALLARQRLLSGRSPSLQQLLAHLLGHAHSALSVAGALPWGGQDGRPSQRKNGPGEGAAAVGGGVEGMAVDAVADARGSAVVGAVPLDPPGSAPDVNMADAARGQVVADDSAAHQQRGRHDHAPGALGVDGDDDLHKLLASAAMLETCLMLLAYGRMEEARAKCEQAAAACGLRMQVSGVMGYRTQYQEDAKAQLVLLVSECASGLQPCAPSDGSVGPGTGPGSAQPAPGTQGAHEAAFGASDILQHPRLVTGAGSEGGPDAGAAMGSAGADRSEGGVRAGGGQGVGVPAASVVLSDMEQAIVLANAVLVKSSGPHGDELQQWEAVPFIEAITAQPASCFMVKRMASLLRCRSERHRSRTRERSYLDLEQLVQEVDAAAEPVSRRMALAFTVWLPLLTGLRKEMGEQMVAYGLVGEALQLFESLQLWDHAISCYRLLGKVNQCLHVVRERLRVTPDDPRLLCILGDLTKDDGCYLAAWDKSGKHYTRAKRSLARTAHERGEYEASVGHWEDALAINPLYPDAWFSLGYAAIKSSQFDKALQAYTRCTQLDPENAEAWNNIGTLAIKKGLKKEALVALSQALKYKRESWQLWDNYVSSAADAGEYGKAIRGMHRLIDLTGGKKADLATMGKVVDAFANAKAAIAAQGDARPIGEAEAGAVTVVSSDAETADGQVEAEDDEGEEAAADVGHLSSVLLGDLPPGGGFRPSEVLEGDEPASPPRPRALTHEGRVAMVRQLDKPLKDLLGKMAAIPSLGDVFWKVKGNYHLAVAEFISATECFLKQCRALQTSGWQSDKANWSRMAAANLDLASSYLRWGEATSAASYHTADSDGRPATRLAPATAKDFTSARMHLRSFLKQSEERYNEEDEYKAVEASLHQILQAEQAASAMAT